MHYPLLYVIVFMLSTVSIWFVGYYTEVQYQRWQKTRYLQLPLVKLLLKWLMAGYLTVLKYVLPLITVMTLHAYCIPDVPFTDSLYYGSIGFWYLFYVLAYSIPDEHEMTTHTVYVSKY